MEGSRWEDALMEPIWPRTLQHTEHLTFDIALQKAEREQKEQANANVPPPPVMHVPCISTCVSRYMIGGREA